MFIINTLLFFVTKKQQKGLYHASTVGLLDNSVNLNVLRIHETTGDYNALTEDVIKTKTTKSARERLECCQ